MKAAANESFGYNEDEIVSSDIVGMRYGSLFDATQTMVNELPNGGCQVQVVSWYDNENSYKMCIRDRNGIGSLFEFAGGIGMFLYGMNKIGRAHV